MRLNIVTFTEGVWRFGANTLRQGLSQSDVCDCGAGQTTDYIVGGSDSVYRPSEGMRGLGTLKYDHGLKRMSESSSDVLMVHAIWITNYCKIM